MKPLKYRQWNEDKKVMNYGEGAVPTSVSAEGALTLCTGVKLAFCTGVPEDYEVEGFFPEFKEIYAEDILEVMFDTLDRIITAVGVVEWNDDGYWCIQFSSFSMPIFDANITSKKIIGNTFENPDLMESRALSLWVEEINDRIKYLADNLETAETAVAVLTGIIDNTKKIMEDLHV